MEGDIAPITDAQQTAAANDDAQMTGAADKKAEKALDRFLASR